MIKKKKKKTRNPSFKMHHQEEDNMFSHCLCLFFTVLETTSSVRLNTVSARLRFWAAGPFITAEACLTCYKNEHKCWTPLQLSYIT